MVEPRRHGFTLIEMVIVIAIVSIMSGALSVFLQNNSDDIARVERIDRWQDQARSALNRMSADIRGSEFALWQESALTLQPNGSAVIYRVEQDGDTPVLIREVNGRSTVMATDVASFEVETAPTLVRVRLGFFTWIGDYKADASHAIAVAVSPRPAEVP